MIRYPEHGREKFYPQGDYIFGAFSAIPTSDSHNLGELGWEFLESASTISISDERVTISWVENSAYGIEIDVDNTTGTEDVRLVWEWRPSIIRNLERPYIIKGIIGTVYSTDPVADDNAPDNYLAWLISPQGQYEYDGTLTIHQYGVVKYTRSTDDFHYHRLRVGVTSVGTDNWSANTQYNCVFYGIVRSGDLGTMYARTMGYGYAYGSGWTRIASATFTYPSDPRLYLTARASAGKRLTVRYGGHIILPYERRKPIDVFLTDIYSTT